MHLIFKFTFPLSVICVTSTIHNLAAFILLAGVFSHAYLGTVANPGTWRVLVDGYVSKIWAEHHHLNWFRMLIDRGTITDDDANLSRGTKETDDRPGTDEESDDSGRTKPSG